MKPEISVVIPAYNEEESLHPLFESLYPVMKEMKRPFEIIFINDGSKDSTLGILYDLYLSNPEVRVIDLNGNFGQHMAIMAGFEHVKGLLERGGGRVKTGQAGGGVHAAHSRAPAVALDRTQIKNTARANAALSDNAAR